MTTNADIVTQLLKRRSVVAAQLAVWEVTPPDPVGDAQKELAAIDSQLAVYAPVLAPVLEPEDPSPPVDPPVEPEAPATLPGQAPESPPSA